MTNVNTIESLKSLAKSSKTADTIFHVLALRERMRHDTDLGRFRTQLVQQAGGIDANDYMKVFKELEKLGLGSVVHGRRGNPSRFKWAYNLKDVGKAALGEMPVEAPTQQIEPVAAQPANEGEGKMIRSIEKPKKSPGRPRKRRRRASKYIVAKPSAPVAASPRKSEVTVNIQTKTGSALSITFDSEEKALKFVKEVA